MTRDRLAVVVLVCMALLVACGGPATTGAIEWRDVDMTLPDGWVVIEDLGSVLYVANGTGGEEEGDPGDLTVGIQFMVEDTPAITEWRDLVAERDGEVELDAAIDVDGVPAFALQYTLPARGEAVPETRERVVVVPSRHLVILAQAVPVRGQQDGAALFLDNVDEVEAILDSIDFGAPYEE